MFVYRIGAILIGLAFSPGHANAAELTGTSWRLVEIQSMNDTVARPENPSRYTLEFLPDGRVAIQADCNRGAGAWTNDGGQLQFGPIASTKAMCPPSSISEIYLSQFEWVRSYVMEDGHLFLATMADGSIIEFEPMEDPTARVLGEDIRISDPRELQSAILTQLFDDYAIENAIETTPDEVDAFVERMRQGMAEKGLAAEKDLSAEEAEQVAVMREQMARSMIRQWKINRALYEEFGGRVIYQQLGPEPLDAYRRYLEARQSAGDFSFFGDTLEAEFWRYFTDDAMHDFMEPGSQDEKDAFAIPPWERKS
ncbi:META domain-containing protein [Hoeflea sp. WL0058]|uniref:META domain-containing protein n=1 Tax=Flavimaribacter sediminis TaxID=2865987 RepID=A0AAE2ZH91_9HYPH|nr:META domain-containing protein [Flavimaribacter sediminis]